MSTSTGESAGGPSGLTIDELAAAVGMTPRNIRAHQTRGLLHPPAMSGRVGFYDGTHVSRLLLVKELQERGLNLTAISALLASREVVTDLFHDMRRRLRGEDAGGSGDVPVPVVSLARLRQVDASVPDELCRLGLLRRGPEGYLADPVQFTAAATLVERGLSLEDLIRVFREISEVSRRMTDVLGEVVLRTCEVSQAKPAEVVDAFAPYAVQLCANGFEALLTAWARDFPDDAQVPAKSAEPDV